MVSPGPSPHVTNPLSLSPAWDQKSSPILSAQTLVDQLLLTNQRLNEKHCVYNIETGDTKLSITVPGAEPDTGQRSQHLRNTGLIFAQCMGTCP